MNIVKWIIAKIILSKSTLRLIVDLGSSMNISIKKNWLFFIVLAVVILLCSFLGFPEDMIKDMIDMLK